MKELWDLPDDFDDPGVRYSLDIGDGLGGHRGYRIAATHSPSAGETRIILEYERDDGGVFHQERSLVLRDGRWRLRPRAVTRHDEPASPPAP